ncbi:unnamed protein product, partial [Ixodes pacificus]
MWNFPEASKAESLTISSPAPDECYRFLRRTKRGCPRERTAIIIINTLTFPQPTFCWLNKGNLVGVTPAFRSRCVVTFSASLCWPTPGRLEDRVLTLCLTSCCPGHFVR